MVLVNILWNCKETYLNQRHEKLYLYDILRIKKETSEPLE